MQNKPFNRALAFVNALMAIRQMPSALQQEAMNNLAPYRSRGKGRSNGFSPRFGKSRSKYTPHFGAKESAKFAARNPAA